MGWTIGILPVPTSRNQTLFPACGFAPPRRDRSVILNFLLSDFTG